MMAAVPPVPAPLPVSVPTAEFTTLFNDASLDPTTGNTGALLNPFLHDLTNNANNISSERIKDVVASSGGLRHALAMATITDGRAHTYLLPHRWNSTFATPEPALDGKFFAIDGELVANQGHTVEIPPNVFELIPNTAVVGTVGGILAALANDAMAEWIGPYTALDQNTESVRTRYIVPIPHSLVGLFLAQDAGMTPRYYFDTIYPLLVTEGTEVECVALTQFFQVAIMRSQPNIDESDLAVAKPSAPPRNPSLIKYQLDLIQHHFPQLSARAATQQQNLIATGIGVLATQQQAQYEEAKAAKIADAANPVAKWFGDVKTIRLLRMLRLGNEAELEAACPVYKAMAKSPKVSRMGVLQNSIDALLVTRKIRYLSLIIDHGQFANFLSLSWHRAHEDSLITGFLGNVFLGGSWMQNISRTSRSKFSWYWRGIRQPHGPTLRRFSRLPSMSLLRISRSLTSADWKYFTVCFALLDTLPWSTYGNTYKRWRIFGINGNEWN